MSALAPADDVVACRALRKRYGELDAVAGVSFDVHRGEVFGLLGPNGAGKTTTIEILEGIRDPDSGEVRVLGLDPLRDGSQVKARIGVQLQTASLYPYLTVRELIELFGLFFPRRVPVQRVLDALELNEKRDAQTRTLSGGQQQRLSVALALVNDPDVQMSTLKTPIGDRREVEDPNVVKVVTNLAGDAIYFSRCPIPYTREGSGLHYKHLGLYVYRRDFLLAYSGLPVGPLERLERLEQLRAIENGYRIRVVETEYESLGVDTPEDLQRVSALFEPSLRMH